MHGELQKLSCNPAGYLVTVGDLSLRPCVTQVVAQTVRFLHLNTGLFSICRIWGGQRGVCVLRLWPAVQLLGEGCRRADRASVLPVDNWT